MQECCVYRRCVMVRAFKKKEHFVSVIKNISSDTPQQRFSSVSAIINKESHTGT